MLARIMGSLSKISPADRVEFYRRRARYLSRVWWCESCYTDRGVRVRGGHLDHREPHRGDRVLFLDERNFQNLCTTHHNASKQRAEARGASGAVDGDGHPTDPRHPWNSGRLITQAPLLKKDAGRSLLKKDAVARLLKKDAAPALLKKDAADARMRNDAYDRASAATGDGGEGDRFSTPNKDRPVTTTAQTGGQGGPVAPASRDPRASSSAPGLLDQVGAALAEVMTR